MTSTSTTTVPTATGDATVVDRFLAAIRAGTGVAPSLYASGSVLDATVPNWRLEIHGAEAIADELSRWFRHPTTIDRLVTRPIPGGVALEVELSWDDGVPHASHQIHVLTLDTSRDGTPAAGPISAHTAFCGGRWPAGLLADMEAARAR